MKYASTAVFGEVEKVVVILPLSAVPGFDPQHPHPGTYGVPDEVQEGWVKHGDGSFVAPSGLSVPRSVSKAQGVLAMYQAGIWSSFETWLATSATEAERLGFQMVTAFERNSPLLEKGRIALGLTVEQVDELFILAATIKV